MCNLKVCYIFYRELNSEAFNRFSRLLREHFKDVQIQTCDSASEDYFSNAFFEFGPIKSFLNKHSSEELNLLIVNDTVFRSHSRIFVRYLVKKVASLSRQTIDKSQFAYGEFTSALGNVDILSSYFVFLPNYRASNEKIEFSVSGKLSSTELRNIIPRSHRIEVLQWVTWRPALRGWYGAEKSASATRLNYKRKLCTITMECELSQFLSRRRILTNLSGNIWLKLMDRIKINLLKIKKRVKSIK